jgi:hypothetical protein
MRSLWNQQEPVYGEGREKCCSGAITPPLRQRVIYSDKPIFYFWAMLAGCLFTGGMSSGTTIPSLVAKCCRCCWLTAWDGASSEPGGFLGAACLATTVMFWWHS